MLTKGYCTKFMFTVFSPFAFSKVRLERRNKNAERSTIVLRQEKTRRKCQRVIHERGFAQAAYNDCLTKVALLKYET
jgi:hypothetical protein